MKIQPWMKMLLAVLAGNLIYFLIAPYLGIGFRHDIFRADFGLLIDMGICAVLYLLIRKIA